MLWDVGSSRTCVQDASHNTYKVYVNEANYLRISLTYCDKQNSLGPKRFNLYYQ